MLLKIIKAKPIKVCVFFFPVSLMPQNQEAHSSLDVDTKIWVKYYTEAATEAFLAYLLHTRQVSLNKEKPKGLSSKVETIFEGVGDVITGAASLDTGGGGALGKLAFQLINEGLQVSNKHIAEYAYNILDTLYS